MSTTEAWNVEADEYQDSWSTAEKINFWLRYANLAPSAHNNQPWKCSVHDSSVTIQADREYTPDGGTPRLTVLSLGAFVENFMTAAHHSGYVVEMAKLPLAAALFEFSIVLIVTDKNYTSTPLEEDLFLGLTKRHTNRGLYHTEPLPANVMDALLAVPFEEGTSAVFITDEAAKKELAALTGRGLSIALTMPPLRRELAHFVHYDAEQSPTGMLVEAMVKNPASVDTGEQFIMEVINIPAEAAFSEEKFATAPLQVVVTTTYEGFRAWVLAGRTFQRILNRAGSLGLTHCISAAPIEVPTLTPILRRTIAVPDRPQLLFRLGFPLDTNFTHLSPRRHI